MTHTEIELYGDDYQDWLSAQEELHSQSDYLHSRFPQAFFYAASSVYACITYKTKTPPVNTQEYLSHNRSAA